MAPCPSANRVLRVAALLALLVAACALSGPPAGAQAPASSAAKEETNPAAEAPAAAAPPAEPKAEDEPKSPGTETTEAPKEKLKQVRWFLLSHEGTKIGYENLALYRLEGPGPAVYRLKAHRFLRSSVGELRPTFLEQSTMDMDGQWTAVAFKTTRKALGQPGLEVEGHLADGRLTVTVAAGSEQATSAARVTGRPTFDGAYVFWLGAQDLAAGRTFARETINEATGMVQASKRVARVLKAMTIETLAGRKEGFLVVDAAGGRVTGHLMRADGQLVRSEGQNHNLAVCEVPAQLGAKLQLDGNVDWRNRIKAMAGDALTSETFGYTLTLPSYPYVSTVAGDGQFVSADNLLGSDGLHVLVRPAVSGDPDALRKLAGEWAALVGPMEETAESRRPVDGLPALVLKGKTTVGGRRARFDVAAVVRQHVGYLVGYLRIEPDSRRDDEVFRRLLAGIKWTKIFGRERGHWDGRQYVSDSYGYRLRLLGPGWRLPQERSGVATNIEAVRDDGSAVMTVALQPAEAGRTLDETAEAYQARIAENVPKAADPSRKSATLDGRPAVALSYGARAIDDEPTESRHVLALGDGQLVVLTFVSKNSALEANLKHFLEAVASFKFGRPAPAGGQPGEDAEIDQ